MKLGTPDPGVGIIKESSLFISACILIAIVISVVIIKRSPRDISQKIFICCPDPSFSNLN